MILFTTIGNIDLKGSIYFHHGIKIEKYQHTPLALTLQSELKQGLGGYYLKSLQKPDSVIAYKVFEQAPEEDEIYSQITYITYLFSIAWYLKFNLFQIGDFWYFDTKNKTLSKFAFGYDVTAPQGLKEKTVELNIDDINFCIKFLEAFLSFNFSTKYELAFGGTDHANLSILQRAVELVELSKLAQNTYLKIGLLCSALECLFTTDNTEVTHKVCERVAFFLSDNPDERISISQKIKVAYTHRSNFFHGNKLKNISIDIFFDIDNIVRRTLVKAIIEKPDVFMGSEKQLNAYFMELVFGKAEFI